MARTGDRTGAQSGASATYAPTGLTGATTATRYVGGTVTGAPTTGTFAVGDFVVTQAGGIWICTVAGTPGTWVQPNFRFARKTADETVNNSAVMQDDDHLVIAVGANETWRIQGLLHVATGLTPDFKAQFTVPAGATYLGMFFGSTTSASAGNLNSMARGLSLAAAAAADLGGVGTGFTLPVVVSGVLVVGGTAGNLTLQWAQNTQDASDTKVLTNSWLEARRVA